MTGGSVEYVASQEVGDAFPEIDRAHFTTSVVLVETNGEVFTGAEAVFRSLAHRPGKSRLVDLYNRLPLFAVASELAYRTIARNRRIASIATRLLWGDDVRPSTYFNARRWFLRGLALVYLIAFISLWVQVDGLVGSNGILPIADLLTRAHAQIGSQAFWILPTLCWATPSDAFLHFLCGSGVVLSLLLLADILPALSLGGLFVCYLSLTVAGQTFLSFQWDILLLESGLIAIFLAPWRLWPVRGSVAAAVSAANRSESAGDTPATTEDDCGRSAGDTPATTEEPVNRVAVFLLKLLLFKLMFMSGVVKLTSGDDSWWDLTALDYHYWSQPLPTIFAWWANLHPEWFKKMSVAVCLVIEVVVPFLIWAPRRMRLFAAVSFILLQCAIAFTGNYCFFNLLTIVLCLTLVDDRSWPWRRVAAGVGGTRAARRVKAGRRLVVSHLFARRIQNLGAVLLLLVTLPLNAWYICSAIKPNAGLPRPVLGLYRVLEPFRICNGYGLFRVMTKDRGEIEIEGSRDRVNWQPYEFKWKPGDVMQPPAWCAPHQPRLDWQMWFAALGSPEDNPWFVNLAVRLLENKPQVTQLFRRNPFPQTGPRYIRAKFYRYRFTSAAERRDSGAWWKREKIGQYLPTISAEQVQ